MRGLNGTGRGVILSGAKDRSKNAREARGSLAPPTRSFAPLRTTLGAALMVAVAACSAASPAGGPFRITTAPLGSDTRLTLQAAPHLMVNARVAPALELSDGRVLRFRDGRRTADSAYYAEPPSTVLTGRHEQVHGTLRVSVCRDDEQICRSLAVEL